MFVHRSDVLDKTLKCFLVYEFKGAPSFGFQFLIPSFKNYGYQIDSVDNVSRRASRKYRVRPADKSNQIFVHLFDHFHQMLKMQLFAVSTEPA